MNAIFVENLHKTYVSGFIPKRIKALRGLSFSVKKGEIYGLLGPNGAGKSTTMKILVGLIKKDDGCAKIFSEKAGSLSSRKKFGFLPETPSFYSYLTGREFLILSENLIAQKKSTVNNIIKTVKLDLFIDRKIKTYSRGMLQRLGLAQALIGTPGLLILDEPLSGVDPAGRSEIKKIINSLKNKEVSILISSHILPDIEEIADRVGFISQGKLVLEDDMISIVSKYHKRYSLVFKCSDVFYKSVEKRGFKAEKSGADLWKLSGEREELQSLFSSFIKAKVQILSFAPSLSTLEQMFINVVHNQN